MAIQYSLILNETDIDEKKVFTRVLAQRKGTSYWPMNMHHFLTFVCIHTYKNYQKFRIFSSYLFSIFCFESIHLSLFVNVYLHSPKMNRDHELHFEHDLFGRDWLSNVFFKDWHCIYYLRIARHSLFISKWLGWFNSFYGSFNVNRYVYLSI